MAQLVEHILGKDEVPSSNLGSSSKKSSNPIGLLDFLSKPTKETWYVVNGLCPLYVICPVQYGITHECVCYFVDLITCIHSE